ncbi:MAG: T9SS type A sorting domain-containing protein [Bacteroidota bacterium]
MKISTLRHLVCLIAWLFPVLLAAQIELPTYPTGAPIRPGHLNLDDRKEMEAFGIVLEEEKETHSRTTASENSLGSSFHASGARTSACASTFIFSTPYNSNNGQRGCMFDVLATNSITIRCFEANLYAGTTANYEIYYRAGTHVGFENNAAAWTLLGSATGITSAGNNLPTALPIPINITIPAGVTYSFYITNDFGAGTSYTDGTAVGNFLAGDANLTVFEGVGKSYPFGLTFAVRNFNGTLFYDLAGPLDAGTVALEADAGASGVALQWNIAAEKQIGSLHLQRSEDGLRFTDIATWGGHSVPDQFIDPAGSAEQYFYRLQLRDQNGGITYSNVAEVQLADLPGFELTRAFPNPFRDQLHLQLRSRTATDLAVQLHDQLGRVVHRENRILGVGPGEIHLGLPQLPAGLYTLHLQGGGTTRIEKLLCQ